MQTVRDSLFDTACPVNWSHPLNNGRFSWWLATNQPGWRGGKLHDLVRGGHNPHDGTLNNSGGVNPTWTAGTGRPGAAGALNFSNRGYVTTANIADALTNWSIGCWFNCNTGIDFSSFSKSMVTKDADTGGGTGVTPGWELALDGGATTGGCFTLVLNDLNFSNWLAVDTTAAYGDGKWHHGFATLSGGATGTIKLYIDGAFPAQSNTSSGTISTGYSNTENVVIGWDNAQFHPEQAWLGSIDDVTIYNRTLTAYEVSAIYQQSKQGYPDLLNYLSSKTYSFPSVSAPPPRILYVLHEPQYHPDW